MKTSKLALNSAVHPQVIEIPQPLEIHPSIPTDLENEMVRVADYINANPQNYDGKKGSLKDYLCDSGFDASRVARTHAGCGCIIAHLSNDDTADNSAKVAEKRWPKFKKAIWQLYDEANSHGTDSVWAVARIEHFLRTGE